MSINHGAIWWSELLTRQPSVAVDFYRKVCGWSFETMPTENGTYHVAIAHGRPIAGITDIAGMEEFADREPFWLTYVAVDDPDAAMEQARFAGGTVIRSAYDVPEVGRIGLVRDASGGEIGLIRPAFPADELVAADTEIEVAEEETDDIENFPV